MRMTEEARLRLCNEMFEGEKSRNFMLHLVRAYSKPDKVKKLLQFGEKQKHKCTMCDAKLVNLDEAFEVMRENGNKIADDFVESMKQRLDGVVPADNPLAKYYKGKTLAYGAEGTDTCMCIECVIAVHKFTLAKLLETDRTIHRTVKDMMDRENGVVREQRPQHINVFAGTALGDLPGFDKLRSMVKK